MPEENGGNGITVSAKLKFSWHYVWIALTGLSSVGIGHLVTNPPTRIEEDHRHEVVDRRIEEQARTIKTLQVEQEKDHMRLAHCEDFEKLLMREIDRLTPTPKPRTRRYDSGSGTP